jgi:hypothetical protein
MELKTQTAEEESRCYPVDGPVM